MTKEVLITISGMQLGPNTDNDITELIISGSYYKKRDKHYLVYEEVDADGAGATKNLVKFDDKTFSITKSGTSNVNMVFEENKKNITNYILPFGSLVIGVDTRKFNITETEDEISIHIDYSLDINYEPFANCTIQMSIKSKTENAVSLEGKQI